MASFTSIPVELQCAIIRLLDPVSLISTSQTSRHFRKVIQPSRKHFLERLLHLECDEKEGGIVPLFDPATNDLSPGWTTPEWKAMRWACTGCLRLLPEDQFDNHSLLRLAYRKPSPGSPASTHISTWDVTPKVNPYLPHTKREKRSQSEQYIQDKRIRRRYALANSNRWNEPAYGPRIGETYHELLNCGWEVFENMPLSNFIQLDINEKKSIFKAERESIEKIRCGYNRHLRKCHERKYQSGQLNIFLLGTNRTTEIPYTRARQFRIPTILDRFYPRFWENLQNKRPSVNPPSYAIYRVDVRDRFWTMHMVRCPFCEKWKEHRAFYSGARLSGGPCRDPWNLSPNEVDDMRCLQCYAKKHGAGPLGMILANGLQKDLLKMASELTYRLGHGFHCLLFEPELKKLPKAMQEEIRNIAEEPNNLAKSKDRSQCSMENYFTVEELGFLRERYDVWMAMRARVLDSNKARIIREREQGESNGWFRTWMRMYDDLEDFYKWVYAVHDEVEKKPEKLAEWALHGSIEEMPPVCTESYTRLPW